jgi:hypothetical protein
MTSLRGRFVPVAISALTLISPRLAAFLYGLARIHDQIEKYLSLQENRDSFILIHVQEHKNKIKEKYGYPYPSRMHDFSANQRYYGRTCHHVTGCQKKTQIEIDKEYKKKILFNRIFLSLKKTKSPITSAMLAVVSDENTYGFMLGRQGLGETEQ